MFTSILVPLDLDMIKDVLRDRESRLITNGAVTFSNGRAM